MSESDGRRDSSNASIDRADRFLHAFRRIERALAAAYSETDSKRANFYTLVDVSKLLVAHQRRQLKAMGDLRNTIVHEVWRNGPIADPREDVVRWIEGQADVIENPPRIRQVLKLVAPQVLAESDDLSDFLALVASPSDFSQAPVRADDGQLKLVTTNALARWFSSSYVPGDGALVETATIGGVLQFAESGDSVRCLSRDAKAVEAIQAFAGELGPSPAAIVLTENGLPRETPLGICVRADIGLLYQSLRLSDSW